jgi:hypothetical protein
VTYDSEKYARARVRLFIWSVEVRGTKRRVHTGIEELKYAKEIEIGVSLFS